MEAQLVLAIDCSEHVFLGHIRGIARNARELLSQLHQSVKSRRSTLL